MPFNGLRRGAMSTKYPICPGRTLIETSKVMSIAVGSDTDAWSAPVYYLFSEALFYFFSNPKARHIQMAKNRTSAASIFRDDIDFKNLEGIQMSGTIQKSPKNIRSLAVAKRYCSRFKIIASPQDRSDRSDRPDRSDILDFFASKFHATLYYFEPECVYYMDNRKGFGSREIIEL